MVRSHPRGPGAVHLELEHLSHDVQTDERDLRTADNRAFRRAGEVLPTRSISTAQQEPTLPTQAPTAPDEATEATTPSTAAT